MFLFNLPLKNPEYLLFIFLFFPVLLIYLLSQKKKKVFVPYLNFWKKVFEYEKKNFRKIKFRRVMTLAFIFLELSILSFSASQPGLNEEHKKVIKVAFLIDLKPSMLAQSSKGTRLDEAKNLIFMKVEKLDKADEILIVGIKQQPVIIFRGSVEKLKNIKEKFSIEEFIAWNGTNFNGCVEYISNLLSKNIVFFISDNTDNLPESLLQNKNFGFKKVGENGKNCGIVQGSVIEEPLRGKRFLSVTIKNFSSDDSRGVLIFEKDKKEIRKLETMFSAGESKEYLIEVDDLTSGFMIVNFRTEADVMKWDDYAYFYFNEQRKTNVWFFYDDALNKYLVKFFEAFKERGYEIKTRALEKGKITSAIGDVSADDIVILDNCEIPENVRFRNLIVIGKRFRQTPVNVSSEIEKPLISDWAVNSSLLKDCDLKDLVVKKAILLEKYDIAEIGGGIYRFQPLIFTDKGVICASVETDFSKMLCVGFLLEDSNLPLLSAYPVLLKNTVEWFSSEEIAGKNFFKTSRIVLDVQSLHYQREKDFKIRGFIRTSSHNVLSDVKYFVQENEIIVEPVEPGFYYIEASESVLNRQWFAVNVFDEKLSDISVGGVERDLNIERVIEKVVNYNIIWKTLIKIFMIVVLIHWLFWVMSRS